MVALAEVSGGEWSVGAWWAEGKKRKRQTRSFCLGRKAEGRVYIRRGYLGFRGSNGPDPQAH